MNTKLSLARILAAALCFVSFLCGQALAEDSTGDLLHQFSKCQHDAVLSSEAIVSELVPDPWEKKATGHQSVYAVADLRNRPPSGSLQVYLYVEGAAYEAEVVLKSSGASRDAHDFEITLPDRSEPVLLVLDEIQDGMLVILRHPKRLADRSYTNVPGRHISDDVIVDAGRNNLIAMLRKKVEQDKESFRNLAGVKEQTAEMANLDDPSVKNSAAEFNRINGMLSDFHARDHQGTIDEVTKCQSVEDSAFRQHVDAALREIAQPRAH